ncbi:MAG: Glu/Leu/Phe/Val dehydrogenase [Legionellales bacterium]|nr:Glu/Leu/Phe/Val dehydrogenase [Legionellales bacterium]
MEEFQFEDIHFKRDKKTGLHAIVAIHNTKLGPALGGCRFIEYPNTLSALKDVMRLAQSMSYKAALAHLKLGGGKSVILKPKTLDNREIFFETFGEFVQEIGGRYITAMDSGTTETDMNIIARKTSYVASNTRQGHSGNPAPFTAMGCFYGMKAALEYKLKKTDFKNIHVVLQGVGQVGIALAKILHEHGAKLTVCDVNQQAVLNCVQQFNATPVTLDEATSIACDIFAPCALGGTINDQTIGKINAPIIAGCANNQLEKPKHGNILFEKDILYAPDYLINAGGLIYACSLYYGESEETIRANLEKIYDRLLEVFARSERDKQATHLVVDKMAKEILGLS